jgi:hypothetical protein
VRHHDSDVFPLRTRGRTAPGFNYSKEMEGSMMRPQPWRADSLQAVVYNPAEPFPTIHVIVVCLIVIAVMVWAGIRYIGGPRCPDCTGVCPICDAAWRRERRGL